ncbi:MAG: MBL fold metallo-hydrolase [Acidobacteriota bacterium]|nr:MBL fold metallo-hydrolase [Acidobacteriota bacterium]
MIIESAAAGVFMKNGFILGCERTREAVYIDPGDEVDQLLGFVAAEKLTVTHILLTHAHIDHVSGVAQARRTLGAPIHLHKDDLFLYDNAVATGRLFGMEIEAPPPVDRFYEGTGPITFGDYSVAVHHTPGHAPGGVCLAVTPGVTSPSLPSLFVGDTLFAGSIGRTDLPGGDYETLMQAITDVLFAFPDEAPVFSGHGPATTIGRERRGNPFVLEYLRA